MHEVASGVFYETAYYSGNVACVLTEEGAVLIDSPMLPSDAWHWLKQIAKKTHYGVAVLVNTDYSVERVLGNCFFPPTVTIAHQTAWIEMQRYDEAFLQRYVSHHKQLSDRLASELTKLRIVPPEVALTSGLVLHKGGRVFRLIHVGGHTQASIMVHLPDEGILFAGDVVVCGEHPALANADSVQWLHALETVRAMEDVKVIVPGLGTTCDASATEVLTEYIVRLRERVYECYSGGCSRRESVDRVKMEDFFEVPPERRAEIDRRIRSSVERVYDEYKKGAAKKRR
jgi:cyclase